MPSEDEARSEHQRPYLVPGQTSYSDPAIAGGGQIYTQVSHPAAYVSYLTERRPVEVFARFENDGAAVDVYDALVIVLDDGTLVSLASNGAATAAKMHYELRVHGTGGVLEQELWKGTLTVDGENGLTEYEPLEDTYPVGGPSANLIDLARGAAGEPVTGPPRRVRGSRQRGGDRVGAHRKTGQSLALAAQRVPDATVRCPPGRSGR